MKTERAFVLSGFGDEISEDFGEQLDLLASEGVRYLELRSAWGKNVLDLTPKEVGRAVHLLAERDTKVSAIASPVGKAPIEDNFLKQLARLQVALERAKEFDTRYVRIFSFYVSKGNEDTYRVEVVRRLIILAEMAERNGVTLLLENDDDLFGESPESMLRLVQAVDSPSLRIVFDPGNFVKAGLRPFDQAYPLLANYVEHVHIKDARLSDRSICLPGQGNGQIPELLADLRARGYRGFLSLEPHLSVAGRSGGFSGPQLFAQAIRSVKGLIGEV